jgi:hypothetical protein
MATVCVKLIENDDEFKGIKTKEPSVKIAIKDGDKYDIKDSNDMDGTEFEKDSMYAQVDAHAIVPDGDDDTDDDTDDGDADKAAAEQKDKTEAEKEEEEEAERKRLEAENDKLMSNVTVNSVITKKSSDGGKRRKSAKRGRKSSKGGRKSAKRSRKTAKKGRKGKGSRRSKK